VAYCRDYSVEELLHLQFHCSPVELNVGISEGICCKGDLVLLIASVQMLTHMVIVYRIHCGWIACNIKKICRKII
jgi:hypothetical protein